MPTFKLNYRNGSSEEVETDAETVEDQTNRTFGLTVEEAEEFGVSVELLDRPLRHTANAEAQINAEGGVTTDGAGNVSEANKTDAPPADDTNITRGVNESSEGGAQSN